MKKILVLISFIAVVVMACAEMKCTESSSDKLNWQQKYSAVFNNVGYQKLYESGSIIKGKAADPKNKLRSLVTNPFGIYDTALTYIFTRLPDKPQLLYATLRLTQINEKMYLAESAESAVYYANQAFIPLHCMNYFSNYEAKSIYGPIEKIYMQNSFYKERIQQTENKLDLKILGINKSKQELDMLCESGAY